MNYYKINAILFLIKKKIQRPKKFKLKTKSPTARPNSSKFAEYDANSLVIYIYIFVNQFIYVN